MNKKHIEKLVKDARSVWTVLDAKSKLFSYGGATIQIKKGKENRFSSDEGVIYYNGQRCKLAHEVTHAVDFILNDHKSRHIEDDSKYLNDDSEIAALISEMSVESKQALTIVPGLVRAGVNVNELLDILEECSPAAYSMYMSEDDWGDELLYCDELAEADPWLGSDYIHYIRSDTCTVEEWIEAGLDHVEDMKDSGEIDEEDYEEAQEYYRYFDASELVY